MPSQTLGILCPSRRGYEQKRGSPAAVGSTFAARFAISFHSCRALHDVLTLGEEHLMGQISGKKPSKPRRNTVALATLTAKRIKERPFTVVIFYFSSLPYNPVGNAGRA